MNYSIYKIFWIIDRMRGRVYPYIYNNNKEKIKILYPEQIILDVSGDLRNPIRNFLGTDDFRIYSLTDFAQYYYPVNVFNISKSTVSHLQLRDIVDRAEAIEAEFLNEKTQDF